MGVCGVRWETVGAFGVTEEDVGVCESPGKQWVPLELPRILWVSAAFLDFRRRCGCLRI